MSAMPIGAPGWPELAFCTASMLSARMALAIWVVFGEATAAAVSAMVCSGRSWGKPEILVIPPVSGSRVCAG